MKKTLSTDEIAQELRETGFSYGAAYALAEFLEEMERDTGEETELDAVAIHCEFSEFESLQEWAEDFFGESWKEDLDLEEDEDEEDEDLINDKIKDYLEQNTTLIEYGGGIIVQDF